LSPPASFYRRSRANVGLGTDSEDDPVVGFGTDPDDDLTDPDDDLAEEDPTASTAAAAAARPASFANPSPQPPTHVPP